ncbi:hypothetical protein GOBAR_DD09484 [Gossypium barbadense]|nr:hypothetical protein GOBAR_DD09484 [Gossypium barbadense]
MLIYIYILYIYIFSLHEHVDKSLCQLPKFSIKQTLIAKVSLYIPSCTMLKFPTHFHSMEATTSKTLLMFWLLVTCIAAVSLGSAVETQGFGGCLMSFASVKGCVEAIHEVVSHEKFDALQPKCCKAIIKLGDNCWPIVFPNQPCLPVLLKTVCKVLGMVVKVENVAAAP